MATVVFYAQFTASKVGVNSLTVTWDIERITRSDGTRSALVTGGANNITVGRRGLYGYRLTGADVNLYDYIATAITATTTVDAQEVPALWTYWGEGVWDAATRTLSSFGTLIADIWAYASRTLTQTAAQIASTLTGSTLTLTNRVTFEATITGLTIPATWEEIYLTAKDNVRSIDAQSVLQIKVSNPASVATDGILFLKSTPATETIRGYGSLTIDQAGGEIAIEVEDDADFIGAAATYYYDIKCLTSDGNSELLVENGAFVIRLTQTRVV